LPTESNSKRTELMVMLALSCLALAVRLAIVWMYARTTPVAQFWTFGFEPSHIGAALARGDGFSSPFSDHGGPTAWLPPVYPALIAASFKLFGVFSAGALWSMLTLNVACATLTTAVVYRIGLRCFTAEAAFGGALLWAVSPDAVAMSVRIGDISLATLLSALLVLWYLRLARSGAAMKDWVVYGVLWGVSALVSTTLMAMMPLALIALWLPKRGRLRKQLAVVFAIVMLAMAPWTIRNYGLFGKLVPIRGNFGAELWMGNHPGVQGPADEGVHPLKNAEELSAYLQMGEPRYVASRQELAMAFIRGNPKRFAQLTGERIASFWTAPLVMTSAWPIACCTLAWIAAILLLWRRETRLIAVPFVSALIFFPLSYYISHAESYYRSPIEPLISLLAVYAFFKGIEAIAPRGAAARVSSSISAR
jgi:4-amino-4-deoxy-L-arabinose transferase-like glycosyltransferase